MEITGLAVIILPHDAPIMSQKDFSADQAVMPICENFYYV